MASCIINNKHQILSTYDLPLYSTITSALRCYCKHVKFIYLIVFQQLFSSGLSKLGFEETEEILMWIERFWSSCCIKPIHKFLMKYNWQDLQDRKRELIHHSINLLKLLSQDVVITTGLEGFYKFIKKINLSTTHSLFLRLGVTESAKT